MVGNGRQTLRAKLYRALAEALAEPPAWLAEPGREWPLFELAVAASAFSGAAQEAVPALAEIPAEGLEGRRSRYALLFDGTGQPRYWLHEAAARGGRLLGPEMLAVERLYRAAGLALGSAELPDHASSELAYLAHLVEQGEARQERNFIALHAGRWLPDLGRALARSGDAVYAPLGALLAHWLDEATGALRGPDGRVARRTTQPLILSAEACILCNSCALVCPTGALRIAESPQAMALLLNAARCVSCGRCEVPCPSGGLKLAPLPEAAVRERSSAVWVVLREAPPVQPAL